MKKLPLGSVHPLPNTVESGRRKSSEKLVGVEVVNVAVTAVLAVGLSEHGPVPEQAPLQPANVAPAAGVAVSVIAAPLAKVPEQVAPQSMPAGALTTLPLPVPALVTVTVTGSSVNVAVTEVAAERVTVQFPAPEQLPPLQPAKAEPGSGLALRVMRVPLG
jgi:hypothetical protein